ncbi:hypothetical protein [Radicibacter daui]|uniref:hypothetical protein n=1 Tax=Radicibacter daui TaxID=3064829 RepID=UPI004046BB89
MRFFLRSMLTGCFLTLALSGAATGAMAKDRHVKITNNTDSILSEFYASDVESEDWEEDILGADVLRPGESSNIDIDDGSGSCHFDFRAVFEDGTKIVDESVNVCRTRVFTYGD